eukprot:3385400-Rhodomonas_salina.2
MPQAEQTAKLVPDADLRLQPRHPVRGISGIETEPGNVIHNARTAPSLGAPRILGRFNSVTNFERSSNETIQNGEHRRREPTTDDEKGYWLYNFPPSCRTADNRWGKQSRKERG